MGHEKDYMMAAVEERLARIETLVQATHDMTSKRVGDLEKTVFGNGKEGLRTVVVAQNNRLADLERDKRERGDIKHNYGLLLFGILVAVTFAISAASLAKQLEWI